MTIFGSVVDWGKSCDILFSYQSESGAFLRRNKCLVTLTGTPKVKEREGDHGTPGGGSLKRTLKGLDRHGNILKG